MHLYEKNQALDFCFQNYLLGKAGLVAKPIVLISTLPMGGPAGEAGRAASW